MTAMKRKMKGRSPIAVTVAELRNSRRKSNSRMMLASEPAEALRESMRSRTTWSNRRTPRLTSIRLPETSIR